MGVFAQDLRYAARQLRRSPGFFGVAALLIALGVAANTQIFTLVNTLLMRPLPVRDPQNLVQLFEIRPKVPAYSYFDYPLYKQLDIRSSTLFQVAGQMEWILPLERSANTERSHVYGVTDNFFSDLGVRPLVGRVLSNGDDHVAVLSYGYWVRSFGRDPKAVGQIVRLKGHPFQIVGIAPEQFDGTIVDSGPDLWVPFSNFLDFSGVPNPKLDNFVIEIIARLRPVLRGRRRNRKLPPFGLAISKTPPLAIPKTTRAATTAGWKCDRSLTDYHLFATSPALL
jgi:hypothetical protein